ncbi:hypothetical protein [Actinoplanes sp. NPDC051494]|uniref:hypothetical protein n=1 Tax=Actinoplanes sp. NPDC051494 TaxID=3363907 RepID=UPI00378DAAF5
MSVQLFSHGTLQQVGAPMSWFGRELVGDRDRLPRYRLSTLAITDPDQPGSMQPPTCRRPPDDKPAGLFAVHAASPKART